VRCDVQAASQRLGGFFVVVSGEPADRAVIALQGVRKEYATAAGTVAALRGIDLEIGRGEVFGIIGRSGAGKSTLIRCINVLERPTAGRITVDGVELTVLDEAELRLVRRRIGMIFQHFNLLSSRTVFGNVALPLELAGTPRAGVDRAVRSMLDFVGLGALADRYPAQLSGGQKQRVGIARALVTRPQILLCDEATSALDPATTGSILELLRDVNTNFGVTTVVITHEMRVIRETCTRIAILDEGRIVESGEVARVFAHPQTAAARELIGVPTYADIERLLGVELSGEFEPGRAAVVRLAFAGAAGDGVVLGELLRRFPVELEIVSGKIERVRESSFGTLLCELRAERPVVENALALLREYDLGVEVLGYVARASRAAA
jgi:D-methionine transport system ATP-binding protein